MATASDDFNRANSNPLAGNWETLGASGGVRLQTNQCDAPSADALNRLSGWKAATNAFGADQYSEVVFNVVGATDFGGVGVRCLSTGGGQGYIIYRLDAGVVRVYKDAANTYTQIGSTINSTPVATDTLRLSATTNGANCDLKAYLNGVQIGVTITDSTSPYTSGQPAIAVNAANVNATKLDNWAGGDLGSTTTLAPGVGSVTINGRSVTTSAFQNVRIRQVLVNEGGQAIASAANISLRVWYGGICAGAPDVSLNGMTTDTNGTTSWSIATGGLSFNQAIFYVAQDSVSYSNYTCARLIPNYE